MTFALLGVGACGGNVLVEPPGGAGGAGGPGPGSSSSSGAGGTDAEATCAKLCAVSDAFNCDVTGTDCVPGCVSGFDSIPAECKDEYADALDCLAVSIPQSGCDLVDVCLEEIFTLSSCLDGSMPGCGDAECLGNGTSCSCKGACGGQSRGVDCTLNGDVYSCTCSLDGSQVGSCSEPFDEPSYCDLQFGCCSAFF